MARTNTLTNYLTDVAEAIKIKKGDDTPILASEFDTEITNLPSGGSSHDWSAIGYNGEPQNISDDYNYAVEIKNNWTSPSNMNNLFNDDKRLTYMPYVQINPNCLYAGNMFSGSALKEIPLLDFSNLKGIGYFFQNCTGLLKIPAFDFSEVEYAYSVFAGCVSLKTIPQLDFSSATDIQKLFYNCKDLETIPSIDISSATNLEQVFYGCISLKTINLLDLSSARDLYLIFNGCTNLENLGGFKDLGKNYETSKSAHFNLYKLDLSMCNKLTHDSLMNVINNLYDIATAGVQTQDLVLGATNLDKLSADEIAIATNKGWTVS